MKTKKIKQLLKEAEYENKVDYDISHRGGHYGLSRDDALSLIGLDVPEDILDLLPPKMGAYCNYLGGGLRGAITAGGYHQNLPAKIKEAVDSYYDACIERYEDIEAEWAENPEAFTDEWNEAGTQKCRQAGIISAY